MRANILERSYTQANFCKDSLASKAFAKPLHLISPTSCASMSGLLANVVHQVSARGACIGRVRGIARVVRGCAGVLVSVAGDCVASRNRRDNSVMVGHERVAVDGGQIIVDGRAGQGILELLDVPGAASGRIAGFVHFEAYTASVSTCVELLAV